MKQRNRTHKTNIFNYENDSIALLEDVARFFEDHLLNNVRVVNGDNRSEVVVIHTTLEKDKIENHLKQLVDDATCKVIIQSLKHKDFEIVMIDKTDNLLHKSNYNVEVKTIDYEYHSDAIHTIIVCKGNF